MRTHRHHHATGYAFFTALAVCAGCASQESAGTAPKGKHFTHDAQALADIANGQRGCDGCGNGGAQCQTYYNSCNEAWCADFVRWVWAQGGYDTTNLGACSGSFYDYGVANGTLHDTPQVGDAIVWNYGEECGGRHVEIVTAVNGGSVTGLSGNGCNSVVCEDYPCSTTGPCDSYGQGWVISAFVGPAGGGGSPPPPPPPPPPGGGGGGGADACSGLDDGLYCGNDPSYGGGNGDPNTLYQCVGQVTQPNPQYCPGGCSIGAGSQDDFCSQGGPPPPPPGGGGGADACSGLDDGFYCGNDPSYGGGNDDPNTLYQCVGQVTQPNPQYCANGCSIGAGSQDDYCN